MAKPAAVPFLLPILLLLSVISISAAASECGCRKKEASIMESTLHRKLLLEKMVIGDFGKNKKKMTIRAKDQQQEDWELRRVPAGPDPLHHNGQDPHKPTTP
ncbi:uncharacterized protein LOC127253610 [Andrographis paniculata]|uniref:uncharacterized protein LOC127253610 n=1 Tax=Andrographis paniculata TaxID=175694 RepID=UPI0021E7A09F|nr:uncharacterized protein LOC127253610 [Andrographis paniculata]